MENGNLKGDLPMKNGDLPIWMVIYPWKNVIFHGYVSLGVPPEIILHF